MNQETYNARVMALLPPGVMERVRSMGAPQPRPTDEERAELEQEIAYLDVAHAARVRQEYRQNGLKSAQKLMQRFKAALLDLEIRYKEALPVNTAKQELTALHAAFKSARIDVDSDAGQALEDIWEAEGLAVALGQVARYKAELGLNPHGIRTDSGRLIGAPVRDERGRPLY